MTTPVPAELLKLAIDAARSASEGILAGFRSPRLQAEKKSDGSPVTEFDRNAERDIRTLPRETSAADTGPCSAKSSATTRRARAIAG